MSKGQNGIVIGLVTSLEDPEDIGRIQVEYPYLGDQPSFWARVVSFMAGAERGARFLPEVGEEVVVAFEQGDPRRPLILGSVWSTVDAPIPHDGSQVDNNWRYIKSRSGHVLRFDDTDGAEKVEVIDKDEAHKIIIDTSGDKIEIICDSGDVMVTAESGKVSVSGSEVNVESSGDMNLKAAGTMTIEGATVNIN
ncbi:phage baseplate assembly protein V [Agarilytica rhodophyticola]|uniref:phage baseplate assembly protein V n=1 Tax=Agarilytica rhodophyticola TaxID=1737490 RepID=UPI000B343E5A|nr:phage baseplate assembly protein V [Agarilytica rhodophyticola]